MSRVDDIWRNQGIPILNDWFGDAAVYSQDPDVSINTKALLAERTEPVGTYGERMEQRLFAQIPVADVPKPQVNATLVVNAGSYVGTYRIEQIVSHDNLLTEVAIR